MGFCEVALVVEDEGPVTAFARLFNQWTDECRFAGSGRAQNHDMPGFPVLVNRQDREDFEALAAALDCFGSFLFCLPNARFSCQELATSDMNFRGRRKLAIEYDERENADHGCDGARDYEGTYGQRVHAVV